VTQPDLGDQALEAEATLGGRRRMRLVLVDDEHALA
jgi:hypothetical protein